MKRTEQLQSEKDYIEAYQDKGFTHNFRVNEGKLIDSEKNYTYKAEEISVVAEHRFEGVTNPGDMSILYAVVTKDDHKGTMLVNYSPSNPTEAADFFNTVPKENYSQKENILNYKQ